MRALFIFVRISRLSFGKQTFDNINHITSKIVMNNKRLQVLLLFFLCACSHIIGDAQNVDSLKTLIKKASYQEKYKFEIELSQAYAISQSDSSFFYAKKALQSAQKSKNDSAIAKAHRWLGEWYQNKTQYPNSASEYWKAIRLAQKIKNKKIESAALNGLGITYYLQNDLKKAEELIIKAATLRYEIKDFTYYSVILSNLAAIYFHNKEYKKAIKLLRKTERDLSNKPEGTYMASLYNSLGGSYQMAYPEKDSAVYYYKKSIEVAQRLNIPQNVMTGYHNLGENELRKKNYNQALDYLYKALSIGKSLGNDFYIMQTYNTLAETYTAKGDYKNALQNKKEELKLNKQIFETEKQKAIKELEYKYETAVKDQKLKEQEEQIQKAQLKAAVEKNKRIRIVFVFIVVILVLAFVGMYLFQKKKNKERIEKEKATIFENIVHDIRTPVTLIKGPLEILKKEKTDPNITQWLSTIETQSETLISLVNELLDASKLEKKKYIPVWKVGNPFLDIEKQIASITSACLQKKITITNKIENTEISVNYPVNVLEKVVANLLSNACKFTPEQGVITLTAQKTQDKISIAIHNTGTTIPSKNKERIFERFYRLEQHNTTSGTGIGLAIVKEVIALVKGTISVENTKNGVQFLVEIPCKIPQLEVVQEDEKTQKPLLLVIEDNREIQNFVTQVVAKQYKVMLANNGQEGIDKALENLPDIILTDILMPVKEGFEVIQTLKSMPLTAHIPIVVCSSKNAAESRIKGLSLGAYAYIDKPFHPDELLATLNTIWQQEQLLRKKYLEQVNEKLPCKERLSSTNEFINKATNLVFKEIENPDFEVNNLAEALFLSRSQLHRKLTQLTGLSATQFIKRIRLEQAKDYLQSGTYNITETAYKCGFNSQSYFSKSFQEYTGKTPSQLLNAARDNQNAT